MTHMLSGQRLESICNYGGYPHGGGDGDVNRILGHIQLVSDLGMRAGTHNYCGAIKEALACNKMEIDGKERGLRPSGPRSTDKVAWVVHGCMIIT